MTRQEWGAWTADRGAVHRRAGGRRHYNSLRQFKALLRRGEVARLSLAWTLAVHDPLRRGRGAWIARQLGVSEATVSRDLKALHDEWLAQWR